MTNMKFLSAGLLFLFLLACQPPTPINQTNLDAPDFDPLKEALKNLDTSSNPTDTAHKTGNTEVASEETTLANATEKSTNNPNLELKISGFACQVFMSANFEFHLFDGK